MSVREGARYAGLTVVAWVGIVVLVLIIGATFTYVFGGFQRFTADYRGETGVRERTLADPNYRIAQYDKFYDLCFQVQSLETQIKNMKKADLPKDQKSVNVLALTNQRTNLINQYNGDSRKAGTQAQFKASDLPWVLDQNGATTC